MAQVLDIPARREHGRGHVLSLPEKSRCAELLAFGWPIARIARELHVSRQSVYRALQSSDGQQAAFDVKAALSRHREQFVRDWMKASAVAAERGDCRPAARALEALGEITAQPTPGVLVQIGFALPGIPSTPVVVSDTFSR